MSESFWPSTAFGEKEETKNTKFSKTMNMFSHWNTIFAFFTMTAMLTLPFINGVKEFPFKIHVPFLNVHQNLYYELVLVWQWIVGFWTIIFGIMCYDYIFVTLTVSSICQLKMLQSALKGILSNADPEVTRFLERAAGVNWKSCKNSEERRLKLLNVCIEHHSFVSEYGNNSLSYSCIDVSKVF